jgi:trans-aconitate methyltransferase
MANGKLRRDPVYLEVLRLVPLPRHGRIVDLGCGRGLMLAVLAEEREACDTARPDWDLRGIEYRGRMGGIARRALGDSAHVEQADLTASPTPACRVALLFDVLHLLPEPAQEALLSRIAAAMEPGGLLVIREADAEGGWRFTAGQATNRLMAILQGRWRRRFHFRSAAGWAALLERFGFEVQGDPRGENTPFANVLLWAMRRR